MKPRYAPVVGKQMSPRASLGLAFRANLSLLGYGVALIEHVLEQIVERLAEALDARQRVLGVDDG
jgi:hypothetical protein